MPEELAIARVLESDPPEAAFDVGRGRVGRSAGAETFLPIVYEDLRRLAQGYLRWERPGRTLQPTALVHEAYLKLADQTRAAWRGKTHFFAVAARAMQRILVDRARERGALKRGGGRQRVTLSGAVAGAAEGAVGAEQWLDLKDALERLATLDPREAQVVTLRYFGGLTVEQVAEVLSVSRRTVQSDWRHAQAWLKLELSGEGE